MKKVAILQSNYIPWKGYFDIIAAVDEFILYDDAQYTKNDWRNRNQIKTQYGCHWLTIPVYYTFKHEFTQKIHETKIKESNWSEKHWMHLELNYNKARHFQEISSWLKPLYTNQILTSLSQLNLLFIKSICSYLGIKTNISSSQDYSLIDGKTERLVDLCLQAGATEYLSGPAAKSYINENLFYNNGLKLTWLDYSGYPEYAQLWGDFVHNVSILDLLFNCGKDAPNYMKYVKK